MKKFFSILSLVLLGCSIDGSGIPSARYNGGRSDGEANGTVSGSEKADAGGAATGGTAGSGSSSLPASASGGTTETRTVSASNSTGGSTGISGSSGGSPNPTTSAPGSSTSAGTAAGGLASTAVGGQTGTVGGTTPAEAGTGGSPQTGGPGAGGNPTSGAGGVPAPDAGAGTSGAAGATGTGGSTTACVAATSGGPVGNKPGQNCLSCHSSEKKPKMTAGGTLYSSVSGGVPVEGATVTITDSKGTKITMITGSTGNFYTSVPIAFPARVEVSKCPTTVAKEAMLTSGACNNCHDASARLHLP